MCLLTRRASLDCGQRTLASFNADLDATHERGADDRHHHSQCGQALIVSSHGSVQVKIELHHAGETISGSVAVGDSPPTGFFGWLELIDLLHRAASETGSEERSQ